MAKGIWEATRDERVKVFLFENDSLVSVAYLALTSGEKQVGTLQKKSVPLDQVIERAVAGESGAQHELCYGFIYETGLKNYRLARRWCTAAAKQGVSSSQTLLAEIYSSGLGVPVDYKSAFEWYMKAAQQGHPHAQLMVGEYYLVGVGGAERSRAKAQEWMKKSADQGHALGTKRLKEIQNSK